MTSGDDRYEWVEAFIVAERREMAADDTVDSVLVRLRERGATAIEAIKVVDALFSLDYPEGKTALHRSPAWSDVRPNAAALHEAAEQAVRTLETD